MKKLLATFVTLYCLCAAAWAQLPPYGLYVMQANETGTAFYGRYITPADPAVSYALVYDGTTAQPKAVSIGTGLTYSSGTLNTSFDGSWAALSGKPSTFTATSHIHDTADITSGTLADARIPALAISKTTGLQSALDGKFANPAGTTSQVVLGNGTLGTLPVIPTRSFSYTTRSLNTCFQISASRDASVSYSVDIATSLSLTSGQQGTVYLRVYTNNVCTTGAQELMRFVNGQTGTLTVGLALTQNVTAALNGIVPAGMWAQLVTENNTGTPTFTARPGQEVLL